MRREALARAEARASAKALRPECAWCFRGTMRRKSVQVKRKDGKARGLGRWQEPDQLRARPEELLEGVA